MAEKNKSTAPETKEVKKAEKVKADKKTKVKKNKTSPLQKIKDFFKGMKSEWKKVSWPSGKTVFNSSIVVFVVVLIVGIVIFGIDSGLSAIIDAVVNLAKKTSEDTETTTAAAEMIYNIFLLG